MDQYSLKLFLSLSKNLNYRKTSRVCNISPSALSRQIQKLEDEVGIQLFERNNRSVQLTSGGIVYKRYAEEVMQKWKNLKDTLSKENKELKGVLHLYCSVTASLCVLPAILDNFHTSNPAVQIKLNTGDSAKSIQQVTSNQADVSITALPDNIPKSVQFKLLTETPLLFIIPSGKWEYSNQLLKRNVSWEKIPMILPEHGLSRIRINDWFRARKIKPNICAEISGSEAIISMVSLGYGAGIVPELVLSNSPLKEQVSIFDIKPGLNPYIVAICCKGNRIRSPLVKAFWDSVSL